MRSRRTGTIDRIIDAHTAVVVVTRLAEHPKYGKRYRRSQRYLVDTPEADTLTSGTTVTIEATRPISRRKHWQIVEIDDQRKAQSAKRKTSAGVSAVEETA